MKTFEVPEIQVKSFAVEDVITTSSPTRPDNNATPFA